MELYWLEQAYSIHFNCVLYSNSDAIVCASIVSKSNCTQNLKNTEDYNFIIPSSIAFHCYAFFWESNWSYISMLLCINLIIEVYFHKRQW